MFVSIVKTKSGFKFEVTTETFSDAVEMASMMAEDIFDDSVSCTEIFEKELKFDEPKLIASLRTIK